MNKHRLRTAAAPKGEATRGVKQKIFAKIFDFNRHSYIKHKFYLANFNFWFINCLCNPKCRPAISELGR